MLLANSMPLRIAASDSSEPSVGSKICLNIFSSLRRYDLMRRLACCLMACLERSTRWVRRIECREYLPRPFGYRSRILALGVEAVRHGAFGLCERLLICELPVEDSAVGLGCVAAVRFALGNAPSQRRFARVYMQDGKRHLLQLCELAHR